MSFGPSKETKAAQQSLQATTGQAQANSAAEIGQGRSILGMGLPAVQSGLNFFQTLAGGNTANTAAALQPTIDQIRAGQNNTLSAVNTLMPRGGGRSSALYSQALAPRSDIQNLFTGARINANQTLPSLGLQAGGLGTNLFTAGNAPLNTAVSGATSSADIAQKQQQMGLNFWSGLGSGVLGLATMPFGGGAASNGLLGMIGKH